MAPQFKTDSLTSLYLVNQAKYRKVLFNLFVLFRRFLGKSIVKLSKIKYFSRKSYTLYRSLCSAQFSVSEKVLLGKVDQDCSLKGKAFIFIFQFRVFEKSYQNFELLSLFRHKVWDFVPLYTDKGEFSEPTGKNRIAIAFPVFPQIEFENLKKMPLLEMKNCLLFR